MYNRPFGFTRFDILVILALLIGLIYWGVSKSQAHFAKLRDEARTQQVNTVVATLNMANNNKLKDGFDFVSSEHLSDFLVLSGLKKLTSDDTPCFFYGFSKKKNSNDFFFFTFGETKNHPVIVAGSKIGEADILSKQETLAHINQKNICPHASIQKRLDKYSIIGLF